MGFTGWLPSNHYRLKNIKLVDKNEQTFTYGDFDRVSQMVETIGDRSYATQARYDALGREKQYAYPSGYTITNHFDGNGYLIEVTDDKNRSLWKALDANVYGALTSDSKGGKASTYTYDDRGFLTGIKAAGIINSKYSYNTKGNLDYRIDSLGQREDFAYDGQNRLTKWNVTRNGTITYDSIRYDTKGNIQTKSNLGNLTMNYDVNGRPHALTSIAGAPSAIPYDSLGITYTDFKKVATLCEGNKRYTLTYGVDDQRRQSVYSVNNMAQLTRYYLGNYEEEIDASGNVRKIHYISGGNGLVAILISHNGQDSLLYAYTDQLGSLTVLTNDSGTVLEQYAYDPWNVAGIQSIGHKRIPVLSG